MIRKQIIMMEISFSVSQLCTPFYGAIRHFFRHILKVLRTPYGCTLSALYCLLKQSADKPIIRHILKILWIRLYGSFSNPCFKLKQSPNSFYNKYNSLYCKLLCLRYCVVKSCLNPIKSY